LQAQRKLLMIQLWPNASHQWCSGPCHSSLRKANSGRNVFEAPKPEPMHPEALMTGELPESLHPVFYAELDGELVKKCALRTKGGAGVSQQEDVLWHKMVTGYKDSSSSLCNAVAVLARRIATECVDRRDLKPCSQIEVLLSTSVLGCVLWMWGKSSGALLARS